MYAQRLRWLMRYKETVNFEYFVRFFLRPFSVTWIKKTVYMHIMQDSATVHIVICCIDELIGVFGKCIITRGFRSPHSSDINVHDLFVSCTER
jgi:hypothetical protein